MARMAHAGGHLNPKHVEGQPFKLQASCSTPHPTVAPSQEGGLWMATTVRPCGRADTVQLGEPCQKWSKPHQACSPRTYAALTSGTLPPVNTCTLCSARQQHSKGAGRVLSGGKRGCSTATVAQ